MRRTIVCALAIAAMATTANAELPRVTYAHHDVNLDSGIHDNPTSEFTTPFRDIVQFRGAPWMRVAIGKYNLGVNSYIILRSLTNGDEQRLDARSIPIWKNRSAMFVGDTVEVILHVAPGETGVFVNIHQALEGIWTDLPAERSQCGPNDDRVASTDTRVGRLYFGGCTAWRITVGPRLGSADEEMCLTAGHCVDFDPDSPGCNPGLPDGVLDLSGVVEFDNIPLSTAGGATNPAPVVDQFPIVTTGADWNFDGECQGLGKDYAMFSVGRNSNNRLPWEEYGVTPFRITRETPAANATIRVTGCGADTGTANFTRQTHTGPYLTENVFADGINEEYQVDTTGGNSGSPVIWEAHGNLCIAIHTNAGCSNPLNANGNSGTSFEHDPLEIDLRRYVRSNDSARFVDVNHPLRVAEEGTVYRPYSTVTLGITNVPNGGTVSIVTGSYTQAAGNVFTAGTGNKPMTLVAPVGSVTIGN